MISNCRKKTPDRFMTERIWPLALRRESWV